MENDIQERYVSQIIADMLKNIGFEVPCAKKYNSNHCIHDNVKMNNEFLTNSQLFPNECSAPTQQTTIDWIRVNYGITISIVPTMIDQCTDVVYEALIWVNKTFDQHETTFVGEYKESVDSAIEYVIKNLI